MKKVALKKCRKKYFTQLYTSRYPFIPTNPLLAAMSFFFPFSSKIPYAYFLNGSTSKKNCIKCAIATHEHCKQSLRCTNNENKIREISPKKFWLLSWTLPKTSTNRRACLWVARIAKLHRKVSKIEACPPPPPLQVGLLALGSKSPDFGRKMG